MRLKLAAVATLAAAALGHLFTHLPGCTNRDRSTINGERLPNCGPFTFNTKSNLVTGATK